MKIRDEGQGLPPGYTRVARLLNNTDLMDEIKHKRGDPGYQTALRAEARKRGLLNGRKEKA